MREQARCRVVAAATSRARRAPRSRRRARRAGSSVAGDAPALDQHDAGRDVEHQLEVLLDDQHARDVPVAQARCRIAPISSTIEGWMPSDGSSRMSSQGEPTSARASARICCSPPDSVPPLRSSRRDEPRQAGRPRARSRSPRSRRSPASRRGAGSPARSGRAGCRDLAARSRCRAGCAHARAIA